MYHHLRLYSQNPHQEFTGTKVNWIGEPIPPPKAPPKTVVVSIQEKKITSAEEQVLDLDTLIETVIKQTIQKANIEKNGAVLTQKIEQLQCQIHLYHNHMLQLENRLLAIEKSMEIQPTI